MNQCVVQRQPWHTLPISAVAEIESVRTMGKRKLLGKGTDVQCRKVFIEQEEREAEARERL